jgi:hypothetical protein
LTSVGCGGCDATTTVGAVEGAGVEYAAALAASRDGVGYGWLVRGSIGTT